MPYFMGRRKKSSFGSSINKSVWQCKGETLSLSNACDEYGVTEKQCQDAKLDCQWRSYFGNSVCIVKRSDVIELKRKLNKEEEEAKEKAAIEKFGPEEWARMKQQEKEKKEAEAAAAKAASERTRVMKQISEQLLKILKFSGKKTMPSIDNIMMAKTKAKREWFLNDSDLDRIESTSEGRSVMYSIQGLIQASQKKHGINSLEDKLVKRGEDSSMNMYAAYLQSKVNQHPADLMQEARAYTVTILKKEVEEAETKLRAAQNDVSQKQSRLDTLEAMICAPPFGDATNGNPSPSKKAKTA